MVIISPRFSIAQEWTLTSGLDNNIVANTVALDQSSNFLYVGGYINESLININTSLIISNYKGGSDAFLMKVDAATGDYIWIITFGSYADDAVNDIVVGTDGDIYFTGFFGESFTFDGLSSSSFDLNSVNNNNPDIMIGKITAQGEILNVIAEGGDKDDAGLSITETQDGILPGRRDCKGDRPHHSHREGPAGADHLAPQGGQDLDA